MREIAPLIDRQYAYIEQAVGDRMSELIEVLERFIAADMRQVKRVGLPPAADDEQRPATAKRH
jgi:hypothetical protein